MDRKQIRISVLSLDLTVLTEKGELVFTVYRKFAAEMPP
jgi:hypothetical protein